MQVLIVESTPDLAALWARHLERQGISVVLAADADRAVSLIAARPFDVIILDLVLATGSALAVADVAQFRQPDTSVIFVTDTSFFSDGSIFSIMPNARAFLPTRTPPDDLAAVVEYYGAA